MAIQGQGENLGEGDSSLPGLKEDIFSKDEAFPSSIIGPF